MLKECHLIAYLIARYKPLLLTYFKNENLYYSEEFALAYLQNENEDLMESKGFCNHKLNFKKKIVEELTLSISDFLIFTNKKYIGDRRSYGIKDRTNKRKT